MARLLLLSPYHGGSHLAFAEGLKRHSRHQCTLLTLPARFWKWRMRGAALVLAQRAIRLQQEFDLVLASDMMNLAEFRALAGIAVPHVLYMHENQLAYPVPEGDTPDLHYGFINVASALAADRLLFNSHTHKDAFFAGLPGLLNAMPDCPPRRLAAILRDRCRVLPVGCDLHLLRQAGELASPGAATGDNGRPPLILWNHRWEFDKAPEVFFRVLARLDDQGVAFRLALAGENSQVEPRPFLLARDRYGARIEQFGWLPTREAYGRLLAGADIVISTALQENFGVSVVEAVACGAWPLLPRRLSYPEILPQAWHESCLYDGEEDLEQRLRDLLGGGLPPDGRRQALADSLLGYDWSALIGSYDDLLEGLCQGAGDAAGGTPPPQVPTIDIKYLQ